jgi:hypothetical protein
LLKLLVDPQGSADAIELVRRVELLERKFQALTRVTPVDAGEARAAVEHTRLICGPSGYALAEVDEPPPLAGARVEHDGTAYTVWRIGPSPLPDDARLCAILV